jgi:hypothetical protein
MKKDAQISIVCSLIAILLAAAVEFFELSRQTKNLFNWLVFLPITLYALYKSIVVLANLITGKEAVTFSLLLMIGPVLLYYMFFIIKLFLTLIGYSKV